MWSRTWCDVSLAGRYPNNQSFVLAEFDNFELASASEVKCPAAAVGSPIRVQWCGEPNTANNQWNFDWVTGMICTCPGSRKW